MNITTSPLTYSHELVALLMRTARIDVFDAEGVLLSQLECILPGLFRDDSCDATGTAHRVCLANASGEWLRVLPAQFMGEPWSADAFMLPMRSIPLGFGQGIDVRALAPSPTCLLDADCKSSAAAELAHLISEMSEDLWQAAWCMGIEEHCWKEMRNRQPLEHLDHAAFTRMRALSLKIGGWVRWDDYLPCDPPGGVVFVPMAEWLAMVGEEPAAPVAPQSPVVEADHPPERTFNEKFPEPAAPNAWIQWKGTSVCMDVHCVCGHHGHVDAEFAYNVKCPECERVYACDGHIRLVELTAEEAANAKCVEVAT